jgi:hypothetical protein
MNMADAGLGCNWSIVIDMAIFPGHAYRFVLALFFSIRMPEAPADFSRTRGIERIETCLFLNGYAFTGKSQCRTERRQIPW